MNFWSLAVEEQFYLLWPFALLWGYRRSPRLFAGLTVSLIGISLALDLYLGLSRSVKYDPTVSAIGSNGQLQTGRPGCNSTENTTCTCTSNKSCIDLEKYQEVPFFMRQAMRDYGLADPSMKGIY